MANILEFANNAQTTLASPLAIGATTATLSPGTGAEFPSLSAGEEFIATLTDAATGLINEIVLATAISGDTVTITRAQEGTSDLAWLAGDFFSQLITAGTMRRFPQFAQLKYGNIGGLVGYDVSTSLSINYVGWLVDFFGSTAAQTLTLPDLTTTVDGDVYWIVNQASVAVTIKAFSTQNMNQNHEGLAISVVNSFVMQPGDSIAFIASESSTVWQTFGRATALRSWSDVTGSRAYNTTYTNSTGHDIEVAVQLTSTVAATAVLTIGGVAISGSSDSVSSAGALSVIAIVPNGATYIATVSAGTGTLFSWKELR